LGRFVHAARCSGTVRGVPDTTVRATRQQRAVPDIVVVGLLAVVRDRALPRRVLGRHLAAQLPGLCARVALEYLWAGLRRLPLSVVRVRPSARRILGAGGAGSRRQPGHESVGVALVHAAVRAGSLLDRWLGGRLARAHRRRDRARRERRGRWRGANRLVRGAHDLARIAGVLHYVRVPHGRQDRWRQLLVLDRLHSSLRAAGPAVLRLLLLLYPVAVLHATLKRRLELRGRCFFHFRSWSIARLLTAAVVAYQTSMRTRERERERDESA